MTSQITFTKSQADSAGTLRTVHARRDDELIVDEYLFSFEGGPWKMTEALEDRYHRPGREFATLADAKDTVRFAERTR